MVKFPVVASARRIVANVGNYIAPAVSSAQLWPRVPQLMRVSITAGVKPIGLQALNSRKQVTKTSLPTC